MCDKCDETGRDIGFAAGIGPYSIICDCHETCPGCSGSGKGETDFAIGIGPYPTNCKECNGKGIVSNRR